MSSFLRSPITALQKGDSKNLARYATSISVFVRDMEDNGCPVREASEAPFFMSRLLSKLEPKDNSDFGREMQRLEKEENVTNLVTWPHQEAAFRSRGGESNLTVEDRNNISIMPA